MFIQQVEAQVIDSSHHQVMYSAYVTNSETLWSKSISDLQKDYDLDPKADYLLYLAHALFGQCGVHMSTQNKKAAKATIKKGLECVEKLEKEKKFLSEAYALKSAFYGLSMGISPMKGMILGPKSDKLQDKALKLDPNNAFAWKQKASSYFHTPSMFGGDMEEAVKTYQKAVDIYKSQCQTFDWQKLDAMVWLGQALHKTKKYKEAITVYEDILKEAPDHGWVKYVLLKESKNALSQ